MPELKALLFDVDGTVADTEKDGHRLAFNRAFEEAGLDWNWTVPLYGKLLSITGGKERIKHFLDYYRPDFSYKGDLTQFIASLHAAKTRYYTEMLAEGVIPLRPGIERLFREARKEGLLLGIATTTTFENVEALIQHNLGIDAMAWFDVVGAGDVVPNKKPAPDIYFYAMARLGLTPHQCLAFEDSENGMHATRGAGLTTVITTNDYTHDHNFEGAALVLNQLGEPDAPFQILRGKANNHRYFTVELARMIHQRFESSPQA
ncbi:MAG: HAD family hydrolase [Gammaproteobacteria bacterium]|nr:HAD family hydrolase [Gammaproteobacteria bacterium]